MLPLCLLLLTPADTTPLPSMPEWIHDWEIQRDFTLAVAEKMPAAGYSFQATPEEMEFGRMMVHLANAIAFRFEQISGEKTRLLFDGPYDKPTVTKFVRDSFDYVIRVLPKIPEDKLAASYEVNWEGRKEATGRQIALAMFIHTAHHRAQLEVYLRLKGIEPPIYTF
jgi:DinB superfamily